MTTDKREFTEILRLAQNVGHPVITEAGHYAVIPADSKIESLERFQYANAPRHKKADVVLGDAQSFIAYYKLFFSETSRVFADPEKGTFAAALDYHGVGEAPASHCLHNATFTLRNSEQWNIWKAANGVQMTQATFSEFIESNARDIFSPSSAVMLECSRDLRAKEEVSFSSAVRLDNGQVQLKYDTTIRGTVGQGDLEVPTSFGIRIPIYYAEAPVELTALLRYRINRDGGKLVFWYDLQRFKTVLEDAFKTTVAEIAAALSTEVLTGRPSK